MTTKRPSNNLNYNLRSDHLRKIDGQLLTTSTKNWRFSAGKQYSSSKYPTAAYGKPLAIIKDNRLISNVKCNYYIYRAHGV
jgi:hypothetical protein